MKIGNCQIVLFFSSPHQASESILTYLCHLLVFQLLVFPKFTHCLIWTIFQWLENKYREYVHSGSQLLMGVTVSEANGMVCAELFLVSGTPQK